MANYIIDVENGSDKGTILPDVGFRYNLNLNQVNEAEIKISGTGANKRGLMTVGATVYIYKNGTLVFKGLIDNTDYFIGGTIVFHASGWEVWLAKENGSYSGSPWTSTASATIMAAIIAESTYLNAGTINAGFSTDYRLATSQSIWNAASNLANKTQQDVSIDYTASPVEISILDHVGSTTSVAVLNEGLEITNVRKSQGYPRGNAIKVYGKGDGDNQIEGAAEDATSIAAYGRITMPVVDRSVMSEAEADKLAEAELALNKDPPTIYDFEMTNPEFTGLSLGDVITINALDQDVTNEEVRIVGIEEGDRNGGAYISLQVTNPELKTLMKNKNKVLARLMKDNTDTNSYMQGSTIWNSWGSGINAKLNYPLKIGFYVPTGFRDEADQLRINLMTVDFDINPYNSQYGSATFTGADPQVQNLSGNDDADVTNTSGSTAPGVTGDSGNTQPDVASNSGNTGPSVSGTSASTTPSSLSGNLAYSGNLAGTSSPLINSESRCYAYDDVYGSTTFELGTAATYCHNGTGSSQTVNLGYSTSGGASGTFGSYSLSNGSFYAGQGGTGSSGSWENEWIRFEDTNNNIDSWWGSVMLIYSHTHGSHTHGDGSYAAVSHLHSDGTYYAVSHDHGDGSYAASSHTHGDGTYLAESHNHPDGSYDVAAADLDHISITDDVGEAGAVNATGVTIYLDFWNGSAWILKNTVIVGSIIDSDIDITDSDTYPDQPGYWRVRIDPNHASADFVQGIVKLKFHVDS